jgi:sortase A
MSNPVSRRIANLLIWLGLALIAFGCALSYPFVRDALQAQSDPSGTLSFVVTLAPTEVEATPVTPANTPIPSLLPSSIAVTPTATLIPTPVILPDDSTPSAPAATSEATASTGQGVTGDTPDRIVIPAIQLDAPVVVVGWHVVQVGGQSDSAWDVPNWRAAGWLKNSAPAGQKGNTVLDGHHNITGAVFKRLVDLKPGDVIELHAGNEAFFYSVTEKHILPDRDQPMQVRIANAQWIQPTDDERLTLVTCWPYTSNTHRLVIVARPISPNGGKIIQ